MKGSNSLYVNQATMVEAVQLWVDATFKNAPRVELVKKDPEYNMGCDCFIVKLIDREDGATT